MAPFESWNPLTTWCSQIEISEKVRGNSHYWCLLMVKFINPLISNELWHLPTANTLFSSVSNGTGFPDWSISFHNPVTPIVKIYFHAKNLLKVLIAVVSLLSVLVFSANQTSINDRCQSYSERSRANWTNVWACQKANVRNQASCYTKVFVNKLNLCTVFGNIRIKHDSESSSKGEY